MAVAPDGRGWRGELLEPVQGALGARFQQKTDRDDRHDSYEDDDGVETIAQGQVSGSRDK